MVRSPPLLAVQSVQCGAGERRERKRERDRQTERERQKKRECFTVPLAASGTLRWGPGDLRYTPRKDVKDALQTAILKRLEDNQTAQLKILVDTANAKGQLLLHTYAEAGLLDMCRLFVDEVATTRAAGHARSVHV